jgi:phosphopantothenoylcysteine decarboxylase/phosphopantothenate--cysteine ligase
LIAYKSLYVQINFVINNISQNMIQKSILLIISGSIAAYKSLELIRRLQDHDINVTCILTKGGAEFITPLSVASLSKNPVYTDLWSLKDETDMGHIRLSRESDLVVVAPASANIIAKMAGGIADDLATTALLATDKPVLIAPAMNQEMWSHPAVQRNIAQLIEDGIELIEPEAGDMACGESGTGRLADVDVMVEHILGKLTGVQSSNNPKPLKGLSALVTAGPTFEPIDPVRFIANRSSGKQGFAIADALADSGADVTLISGPTDESLTSRASTFIRVVTAEQMFDECVESLPADIVVCTAAVADWKPKSPQNRKMKKRDNSSPPAIELATNPDILKHIATLKKGRPKLVVGFAAETENLIKNATTKLTRKGCDMVVANDVSAGKVFGSSQTDAYFITHEKPVHHANISKQKLASELVRFIEKQFAKPARKNLQEIKKVK